MKIISIRAPWWWYIIRGWKDIENRDWATNYRGPILLHASSWWSLAAVADDTASAESMRRVAGFAPTGDKGIYTYRQMRDLGGHIVGRADITNCVADSASPWFCGKYGFVLANAKPVTPIPLKARLGLFDAPAEIISQLKDAA